MPIPATRVRSRDRRRVSPPRGGTFLSEQGQLSRVLGNKDVLALAFGAMIGWGWVVLAGEWVEEAGALGAIIAFAIGGVGVILIGLTFAELASAMPVAGGEHVYSYRALGMGASFLCMWAMILGYVSVVAFEAVALPTVVEQLFPNYKVVLLWNVAGWDVYLSWAGVGVAGAVIMTWVNLRGIESTAVFQKAVTVGIVVVGVMLMSGSLFNGETANMDPIFVDGISGSIAVLIMTPFMFVGFDVIPQTAEEINLPFDQIGKVLLVSVLLAVGWYIAIILAVSLSLSADENAASTLAAADAMTAVFGGPWAGRILVVAGIGGIITSWNAFFVGGSRAIYAMAKSNMLPPVLGKLHPRYNTPVNAILLIGALSVVAPLFGRKTLGWLVNAGGLGIVVAYAIVALSFLVLRRNAPEMNRPFRVPYGTLVGGAALALSFGLVLLYLPISPAALGVAEWAMVLAWSVVGVGFYLWARKAHTAADAEAMMRSETSPSDADET